MVIPNPFLKSYFQQFVQEVEYRVMSSNFSVLHPQKKRGQRLSETASNGAASLQTFFLKYR